MSVLILEPQIEEDSIVILNRTIGEDPFKMLIFADMKYLQEDVRDYSVKLRELRGLPKNAQMVQPGEELIMVAASQLGHMPEANQRDRDAKNKAIKESILSYYNGHIEQCDKDATILACTTYCEFTKDPEPYPEMRERRRPGLMKFPAVKKDISQELERRLKQAMDAMSETPGAFAEFLEAVELMSVDSHRGLVERDKDGFRGTGVGSDLLKGIGTDSSVKVEEGTSNDS